MALVVLACVGWWLAGLMPSWYAPPDATDDAVRTLGEKAEYRLVEEFQKIRPPEEVWRLRIPADAINAWLAARLPAWLSGQGAEWPTELGIPQVHITPSGLTFAIQASELGGRTGTLTLWPVIDNGMLSCDVSGGIGRLPLPIPLSMVHPLIEDATEGSERLTFLAQLTNGDPVASTIPLVDHRQVRLQDISCEDGGIVLTASTFADRNH